MNAAEKSSTEAISAQVPGAAKSSMAATAAKSMCGRNPGTPIIMRRGTWRTRARLSNPLGYAQAGSPPGPGPIRVPVEERPTAPRDDVDRGPEEAPLVMVHVAGEEEGRVPFEA